MTAAGQSAPGRYRDARARGDRRTQRARHLPYVHVAIALDFLAGMSRDLAAAAEHEQTRRVQAAPIDPRSRRRAAALELARLELERELVNNAAHDARTAQRRATRRAYERAWQAVRA